MNSSIQFMNPLWALFAARTPNISIFVNMLLNLTCHGIEFGLDFIWGYG